MGMNKTPRYYVTELDNKSDGQWFMSIASARSYAVREALKGDRYMAIVKDDNSMEVVISSNHQDARSMEGSFTIAVCD